MTVEDGIAAWVPADGFAPVDVVAAARELVAGMVLRPWGEASPSVYETGRLVSLVPWLTRHAERVAYLVRGQRPDGGWGAAGGYDLVPTLSATEALLSTLDADPVTAARYDVPVAVDRALRVLSDWLHPGTGWSTPDMPAVELIVPALVGRINHRLDRIGGTPVSGLDAWRGEGRLALPRGLDRRRLDALRHAVSRGAAVPEKLLHALEVVGVAARSAPGVRPASSGAVGASPAATAAWLPGPEPTVPSAPALAYLREAATRQHGPVPCATPITVFERAWVLGGLARVGVPLAVPAGMSRELAAALGPDGAEAAPGLPRDADTTSVVLYALGQLGGPVDPASLLAFRAGEHFCTWQGENGFSVTTNAHVLDAIGAHLAVDRTDPRFRPLVEPLSDWLAGHQQPDGWWQDRWHASPYYATACCALALDRYGRGSAAPTAVRRAVRWVLDSQRPDGSWGRWAGTVEETAYAIQVLLATDGPAADMTRAAVLRAAGRGYRFLRSSTAYREHPPLWHDKDLYLPGTIVRAAGLAAVHLVQRRLSVTKIRELIVDE